MPRRPRIFIGSSTPGLKYANALQAGLGDKCEVTPWKHGVFRPGKSTLDSLVKQASRVDFAALILTPDDLLVQAGEPVPMARDNVLFEAGLFMGTLGPTRTFLVCSRDQSVKLPTDLDGLTKAQWGDRSDENWEAALNEVSYEILQAMKEDRRSTTTTDVLFDGRYRFKLDAWTKHRWNDAQGDVALADDNVLSIDRTNTQGQFVLRLDNGISHEGDDRVLLRVGGQVRAVGAEHTFLVVFKEAEAPMGEHMWDARTRVRHGAWRAIDAEREVRLADDCLVRLEDRSVSTAPSKLEVRDLQITVDRFKFDLDA
jgi:hypothetical protein